MQCDLAVETDPQRLGELRTLERILLDAICDAWDRTMRPLGVTAITFERGLPDGVQISATDFLRNAEALFDQAPIRKARLTNLKREQLGELTASDFLVYLTSLDLGTRDFDRKDSLLGKCVRSLRRLTG